MIINVLHHLCHAKRAEPAGSYDIHVHVQTVKCGDYFQRDDAPREFGKFSIITKSIQTTESSVVLRHLEVIKAEVSS